MDDQQAALLVRLRRRHMTRALQELNEVRDSADLILRVLDNDSDEVPTERARSLLMHSSEVLSRLAMLEAITDTTGFLAAEPVTTKEA